MRTYEETHPWIDFTLDMREAPYRIWLLLGQAQAKCEHVAGVPLLPGVAKRLHQIFLAKGVLATTAIEGNTLTEEEVQQRIAGKLDLPPSKEYLGREIDNIVEACNLIKDRSLSTTTIELCADEIKEYNALALRDLPLPEGVVPGEIRTYPVGIPAVRYRGAPPEDLEFLLARLCEWLNARFEGPERFKIAFGILKAIMAHIYIAWIHPFGDGNGRTARLIEFKLLLSVGVPTTAAHLLSNHYNQTRSEYYRHLDQTHRYVDGLYAFIEYALQGFIDNLEEQIRLIERQQLTVHWENYIHNRFRNRDSVSDIRRRRLILDLSGKGEPVPIPELRHVSPRIAEAYAGKTLKTIQRDVTELEKMDLIVRTTDGVRANWEIMLAFVPERRSEEPVDIARQVSKRRGRGSRTQRG